MIAGPGPSTFSLTPGPGSCLNPTGPQLGTQYDHARHQATRRRSFKTGTRPRIGACQKAHSACSHQMEHPRPCLELTRVVKATWLSTRHPVREARWLDTRCLTKPRNALLGRWHLLGGESTTGPLHVQSRSALRLPRGRRCSRSWSNAHPRACPVMPIKGKSPLDNTKGTHNQRKKRLATVCSTPEHKWDKPAQLGLDCFRSN